MNLDALPHTVLIILAEFSVGSLIALLIAEWRGMVPWSYVKFSAGLVAVAAVLVVLASANATGTELEGYELRSGLFTPIRVVFIVFLGLLLPYVWATFGERRVLSFQTGALAAAAGLSGLCLVAFQVSPPTWGAFGVSTSFLGGALALGLVSQAMVLGHWYLISPKLPGQPLQELTFMLTGAIALQGALLILNASVPAREVPESAAALAGSLATNTAFWLRVGVGLVFPLALAFMAWRSSLEHAMMSATGLLYIAVGGVFAGEVLARGLLFVTAAPV